MEMIRVDVCECELIESGDEFYYKHSGKFYIPYGCTPNGLVTLAEVEDKSVKLTLAYIELNKNIKK